MNEINIQPTSPELLTVEQFAQRLQVSRATVFSWIQRLILKNGCHYFKIGRVLRFMWSEDVVKQLLESSAEDIDKTSPVKPLSLPLQRKKSYPINLDY